MYIFIYVHTHIYVYLHLYTCIYIYAHPSTEGLWEDLRWDVMITGAIPKAGLRTLRRHFYEFMMGRGLSQPWIQYVVKSIWHMAYGIYYIPYIADITRSLLSRLLSGTCFFCFNFLGFWAPNMSPLSPTSTCTVSQGLLNSLGFYSVEISRIARIVCPFDVSQGLASMVYRKAPEASAL